MALSEESLTVNGRDYPAPKVCAAVICLDGCEPAYLDEAAAAGCMPALKRIRETGSDRLAQAVVPTFTNPNNLSIATGRPPKVHGICGNFFFDPESEQEVTMNEVRFLRAPTLFQRFYEAGAKVAAITAKDKLRALLGAGLRFDEDRARCFSAEQADSSTLTGNGVERASAWLGRPQPAVYSADLSEFVLAAGVKLLREWQPDLLYLTTSDYVQHKHAPGRPEANRFYAMVDGYLAQLDALGASIAITADHGMKPKHKADGSPSVLYAQDLLDGWLGKGAARVILPIADPYVVHHGALGSFATVYLPETADRMAIARRLAGCDGLLAVLTGEAAAERFELPADRIGDLVLISTGNATIGSAAERHDLAALKQPLRSHGGLTEQIVPFVMNRACDLPPVLRNFDAFFHAIAAAAE